MRFARILLGSLLIATTPVVASAQSHGRDRGGDYSPGQRQDQAREETRNGSRMELGDIVRRVSAGRPGRMLGVRPQGSDYVVRWEYPGGRVADLYVDGRTGRVMGEG